MRWPVLLRAVVFAPLLLGACQAGDSAGPAPPAAISQSATPPSIATVGAVVSPSPTFMVQDAKGSALSGVPVTVRVTRGGGKLEGAPSVSGAGATSIGTWTLGTAPGEQSVTVDVAGVASLVFRVTGAPGAPAQLKLVSNATGGPAGSASATPYSVRLVDAYDNGVAGQPVTFAVTAGGGSLATASAVVTDSSGLAVASTWTFGKVPGANTLSASSPGVPTVSTTVQGAVLPPTALQLATSVSASATVASVISALKVKAVDVYDNGVPNVVVSFAVTSGGGALDGTTSVITDATGIATAPAWTLGTTVGANALSVMSSGLANLSVPVTGLVGPAKVLTLVSGGGQSVMAGDRVPTAFVFRVTDQWANVVAGAQVTFAVTGGGGSLASAASVASDALGQVTMPAWTLGKVPGTNSVTSTVSGVTPLVTSIIGTPPPPSALTLVSSVASSATVATSMGALKVRVTDKYDNRVSGVTVTWAVASGGGTLAGSTSTQTGVDGEAASPAWTLGTLAGSQSVIATSNGLPIVTISVMATPGAARSFGMVSGGGQEVTPSSAVPNAIVVRALDQYANGVSGVAVTFSVAAGGGTLAGATTRTTDASGQATAPTWTLGPGLGAQTLQASASGLSILTITATGIAGAPALVSVVSGAAQSAGAGATLALPIVVRVTDAAGRPVSGRAVTFAVTAGGGHLASSLAVTSDANGQATSPAWTLGPSAVTQWMTATAGTASVTVSATVTTGYSIDLRYVGTPPSAAIQAAFSEAMARIAASITGTLSTVAFSNFNVDSNCSTSGVGVFNGNVSTLVIYASVLAIDGAGGVLGNAGPCVIRSSNSIPALGTMRLDVADLNSMLADGRLTSVIMHEMLHVVGFGTVWTNKGVISGAGTAASAFTGTNARAACTAISGVSAANCTPSIPLEASMGTGSNDSHWRESVFGVELMTPAIASGTSPFSAMTIASLADLGYTVNLGAADPFSLSASLRASRMRAPSEINDEVLRPIWRVDRNGELTRIPRQ